MKKKIILTLSILLFVVGIGFLAVPPIVNNYLMPKNLDNSYTTTFKELDKNTIASNSEKSKKASDKDFDFSNIELLSSGLTNINPKIDKSKIVGEVYIPKVNLHLPITYGTNNENLLYSATTMKKEQEMGKGNYALAGHNAENRTVLFAPLHDVKDNDFIYVTDKDKIYQYLVDSITIVKPSAIEVIDDVKDSSTITLVTCEDFAGTKRLIVQGTLLDVQDYEENMKLELSYKKQ